MAPIASLGFNRQARSYPKTRLPSLEAVDSIGGACQIKRRPPESVTHEGRRGLNFMLASAAHVIATGPVYMRPYGEVMSTWNGPGFEPAQLPVFANIR